jgi:hypothetical protein
MLMAGSNSTLRREWNEGFDPQNVDELIHTCKEVRKKVDGKGVVSFVVERLERVV